MKNLLLFSLFIVMGITICYLAKSNLAKEQELVLATKEIEKNWDDKLADYQFLVNVTYRASPGKYRVMMDSLETSFKILRRFVKEGELKEVDSLYLSEMIFKRISTAGHVSKEEILEAIGVESEKELFKGAKLEVVNKLTRMINPFFMSKCSYSYDFDVWQKTEKRTFEPGDTTKLMIRLLKSYDLRSHQEELVASENMKIIEPYLGELLVVIPDSTSSSPEISFQVYNWIENDTTTRNIYFF